MASTITYIYTLSNPITGDVRYVGKTNNLSFRFSSHNSESRLGRTKKESWIKSLHKKGLTPIIEVLDTIEDDAWGFWEKFWISQLKTWGFDLTNLTSGGEGAYGHKRTVDTQNRINNTRRLRRDSGIVYKGRVWTKESKDKLSNTTKGRKVSPETGIKIMLTKGYAVIQKSMDGKFIREFSSGWEAVRLTGISKVHDVCRGERSHAGGYLWQYKTV